MDTGLIARLQAEIDALRQENTELRHAEKTLRESEMQLQMALECAEVGLWVRDPQGGWVATPQLNALFGRHAGEPLIRADDYASLIHPDDLHRITEAWNAATGEGGIHEQKYRMVWPDGSVHWLYSRGRIVSENGLPRFMGITYDTTDYTRAEETG